MLYGVASWPKARLSPRSRSKASSQAATFEAYRNSGDFLPYDRDQFRACAVVAKSGPEVMLSPLQIRLEPFQEAAPL